MTAFDRFETRLPELMADLAAARVPDYVDDMLEQASRTRQRPAWASLERSIPVDITAQTSRLRAPSLRPIVILVILALAVIGGAILYAGSQKKELPPPFGPAANGALFYAGADGVIYSVEPTTGVSQSLVSGPDSYTDPVLSRDGRRMAFHTGAPFHDQVTVADADGSNVHPLVGTYDGIGAIEWSPDDRQVAILSTVDGVSSLSILATDGTGVPNLPFDREIRNVRYLPDGRLAFIGSESAGAECGDVGTPARSSCALFVTDNDGTNLRVILPAAEFYGLGLIPSPDGLSLMYNRWNSDEAGDVHIVDIDSGQDRQVPVEGFEPGVMESNVSELSPDGSQILFDRYEAGGDHWAVVPVTGGPPVNIGLEWPDRPDGRFTEAHWSPDGAFVVAYYPTVSGDDELWLLDPTGQGQDRRLTILVMTLPAWQRLPPGV